MKKAALAVYVMMKHAAEIDPAAIYERVIKDPMGKAPTILGNAKSIGVKGYPKFVTSPIISKVENNVEEYAKMLPTLNPQKVQEFIKKNPGIFKGVQSSTKSITPIA